MDQSVIYAIRHIETNRLYIGSATNRRTRWSTHRWSLRRGIHHNCHLQNAWNKYGEGAFEFGVLQRLPDAGDLEFWEQFWIDRMKPAFNAARIAGNISGYKLSDEAREKISASKRGRKLSQEHKDAISQSAKGREIAVETRAKISAANKGAKKPASFGQKISEIQRGRPHSEERRKNMSNALGRHWHFVSPEGEHLEIFNLTAFSRENGLSATMMGRVASGKVESHRGWRAHVTHETGGAI